MQKRRGGKKTVAQVQLVHRTTTTGLQKGGHKSEERPWPEYRGSATPGHAGRAQVGPSHGKELPNRACSELAEHAAGSCRLRTHRVSCWRRHTSPTAMADEEAAEGTRSQ